MRKALQAALIGALLVVAGCTGAPGGTTTADTQTQTTISTETTATTATTTTTTTPAPEQLAPGLTENGVANAADLASAHSKFLQGRQYTIVRTHTEESGDGTLLTRKVSRAKYERSNGEYFFNQSINGTRDEILGSPTGHLEIWSDGSSTYSALTVDGNTTYKASAAIPLSDDHYGKLYTLLSTTETKVVEKTPEGRYTIEATNVEYPGSIAPDRFADVKNVSFTATVTADGLVENYEYAYTGVKADGSEIRVSERGRFVAFEDTTVESPEWVSEAAEATG